MPRASTLAFKPVNIAMSMGTGLVAGALFKRAWKAVRGEGDPPGPLESEYGWLEVLAAAAIQGLIYSLVKATLARGGAVGFQKITGTWPGD